MKRRQLALQALLAVLAASQLWTPVPAASFAEARIYIEYNDTDNDLGFHVSLDGEDWRSLRIVNPLGKAIFEVEGRSAYRDLGMTELFFEGAEPSLDEFPLEDLLALFPEGRYTFVGTTVEGTRLSGAARLSHAIPDGPVVSAEVDDGEVIIRWQGIDMPPAGFPSRRIEIAGYQVIAGSFQVTLPAWATEVELPEEYVASLAGGAHDFEVLTIDASGNRSISSGTFEID